MTFRDNNLRKKLGMSMLLSPDTGVGGATGIDNKNDSDNGLTENSEGNKSFDEILQDENFKSEFDKRIAKVLESEKAKWETEKATELTEAEKLAKMNEEEREKYEFDKRKMEFEAKEKEFAIKELKLQAKEILIQEEMNAELIDVLNFSDAETCKKHISLIKKVINLEAKKIADIEIKERLGESSWVPGGGGNFASNFGSEAAKRRNGKSELIKPEGW
ncbi:DUF4355 domain-containing protein [Clostridium perfringens]|nr:DUF4355 domain-containing protein [Clostridium perfringens]MDK0757948.1 DUF4355 domain-containing protein [Clostridium perfringens]